MLWEEIKKQYPEQWIGVTNVVRNGGRVVSADVLHTGYDKDDILSLAIKLKNFRPMYVHTGSGSETSDNFILGGLHTNKDHFYR